MSRILLVLLTLPLAFALACGDDDDDGGDGGDGGDPTGTATATDDPTQAEGEQESVFELEVGDCFNDDAGGGNEATEVEVIDCAAEHDNEIYFEYEIEEGDFPGNTELLEESLARCVDEFEAFVGLPYDESELEVFPVYPTEESWEAGDRIVYCAVYAADLSKLTGSMEGAAR